MRIKITNPEYQDEKERDIALQKAYNNLQRIFYYGAQERLQEEKEKREKETNKNNEIKDEEAEKREDS